MQVNKLEPSTINKLFPDKGKGALNKISSFGGKTSNFTTWERFLKEKTIYEGPEINLNIFRD